jgi:hypothetical protein
MHKGSRPLSGPRLRRCSREMTNTGAAAWEVSCSFLDTEVTSILIRFSRSGWLRYGVFAERAEGNEVRDIPEKTRDRRESSGRGCYTREIEQLQPPCRTSCRQPDQHRAHNLARKSRESITQKMY